MYPEAEACSTNATVVPAGILASESAARGPVVAVSAPLQKPTVTSRGVGSCDLAVVVTTASVQYVSGVFVNHCEW